MGDCAQNSLNNVEGNMESKDWKKKKYNSFMKEDSVSSLPVDDACNKHKKKKHAKDRQTETENHGIYMYLEPDSENMSSKKTLKKKKKRKKLKFEDGQIDQRLVTVSSAKKMEQDIDHVSSQNHGAKKKKHKKQMNLDDNRNINIDFTSDQAIMAASDEIVTKKKKKKKKHLENNCTEASLIMEMNILEPMSAHTEKLSKKEKKKKEKDFDEKNELAEEVNEENIQKKFSSPEKKKKRKRNSNDIVSASDSTLNGGYSDMNTVPKKKGRIGSAEGGQGSNAKDQRHQAQKMDEKYTEDCDKSGRKEKANESNQWVTASLGTEERDKKFLRLLGGFRKGTESSSTSFKTDAKGGNLAMNREQENLYRKEMETVYEKAMSMSLQRGVGLGYEPPPDAGKKFFIDKNKNFRYNDPKISGEYLWQIGLDFVMIRPKEEDNLV